MSQIATRLGWTRTRVLRTPWFSTRLDQRAVLVTAVLAALVVAAGFVSMVVGDFPLTLGQIGASLSGSGDPAVDFVVRTLRLPRVLTGALVGAALGMSGAALQSLAQNPLGSPDIIGFDRGAAVGAIVMLSVFGASGPGVAIGAVLGGTVTAILVYLLAWKRGVRSYRLVLVGIGIGFTATAIVDYLLTWAEINAVEQATIWITGSLNGRTWNQVRMMVVGLLVLGPAVVVLHRTLDRLALGDDTAAGLGVRVNRAKLGVVAVAVALSSLAVAAAGPIAFVAFVSGPIARRLVATPAPCLVPAAFVGALVTVGGDLAARSLLHPVDLPVGIATSILGAPYLLWILARQAKTGVL